LKAEIQGLLKELSEELKQLEANLETNTPASPQAGTGTDPELFGAGADEAMPMGGGTAVPVHLRTDVAEGGSRRQGTGTGLPSGEVSADAPRSRAEAAQLSDVPREELPVVSPAVPPQYRGIFDRLRSEVPASESEAPL
jgi:hypothetical protein